MATLRSARHRALSGPFGRSLDRSYSSFQQGTADEPSAGPASLLMRFVFFYGLLILVVVIAAWRGTRDERLAALTCLLGTVLTTLVTPAISERYSQFEAALFLVDLMVFVAFLAIALRSDRFWPLWVAGLQLTATAVHLLKLARPDLMPFVVGAALAFWSYPILVVIAVGSWRTNIVQQWRRLQYLPDRR